jgi:hypothetical protein
VPVVHICNLIYSGGRYLEDLSSNQLWQLVRKTVSQKNPSQKRVGGVAQGVGLEFKPQYHKRKQTKQGFICKLNKF